MSSVTFLFVGLVLAVLGVHGQMPQPIYFDLPYLQTPLLSSHFEAGLLIGRTFKQRIQGYVAEEKAITERLLPFTKSQPSIYDGIVSLNRQLYPKLFDEMLGIAEGAGVALETILALNFEPEIDAFLDNEKLNARESDTSCSDILHNGAEGQVRAVAHNEDAAPLIKKYAYMVNLRIANETSFTSYWYPGVVGGGTFGFNEHGLVVTTNAEFPIDISKRGAARYLLNRQLYSAKTVSDAKNMLLSVPAGLVTGFSANLASVREGEMLNLELAPTGNSVLRLKAGDLPYFHVNQYTHLSVPQHPDPSSIHRLARAAQLPVPMTVPLMFQVLGDTADPQYPIYRDGNPPDESATVATALFDLRQKQLWVYTSNPKIDPYPKIALNMV